MAAQGLEVVVMPVGMLAANCVLVIDKQTKEALVVDPGDEAPRVKKMLDRACVGKVLRVVATHAHFDHVAAAAQVAKLCGGAPIAGHEADRDLWGGVAKQFEKFGMPAPEGLPTGYDVAMSEGKPLLEGNSALAAAQVLHTPGHSPGSVCIYWPGAPGLLLSGDTLFAGGFGRTDLWGGSESALRKSLMHKLFKLPGETRVITGHGEETTIAEEKFNNPIAYM
eukprot:TRINITY_DN18047_c0_g1_i1.p1 TRINITY_DN18047_c0_g1~~TRINITY_DN18047_c0_g1_i1.p1  ORF type:complete len:236 (+),score=66.87 TRINITY_DN18047_c0_g1_i1:41-709(+)